MVVEDFENQTRKLHEGITYNAIPPLFNFSLIYLYFEIGLCQLLVTTPLRLTIIVNAPYISFQISTMVGENV